MASKQGWTSQVWFSEGGVLQHVDEMEASSQHKHSKRGMKKMLKAHKTAFVLINIQYVTDIRTFCNNLSHCNR
tara:strand:+ start:819 stop:1037 length:219 start_codon:yes stop_codon:yes gene_type:complete